MRKKAIIAAFALAGSIIAITPAWADTWVQANNTWEYHKHGIRTQNLWIKGSDNRSWYYIKADGKMASNEWVLWNGNRYYLHTNGVMADAQWVHWNNIWYYLNPGGTMAKSQWIKHLNDWYYVDANGAMLSNTTVDGYTLGTDGRMLQGGTGPASRPGTATASGNGGGSVRRGSGGSSGGGGGGSSSRRSGGGSSAGSGGGRSSGSGSTLSSSSAINGGNSNGDTINIENAGAGNGEAGNSNGENPTIGTGISENPATGNTGTGSGEISSGGNSHTDSGTTGSDNSNTGDAGTTAPVDNGSDVNTPATGDSETGNGSNENPTTDTGSGSSENPTTDTGSGSSENPTTGTGSGDNPTTGNTGSGEISSGDNSHTDSGTTGSDNSNTGNAGATTPVDNGSGVSIPTTGDSETDNGNSENPTTDTGNGSSENPTTDTSNSEAGTGNSENPTTGNTGTGSSETNTGENDGTCTTEPSTDETCNDPNTGETPTTGEQPQAGESPTVGEQPQAGENPTTGEQPQAGENPTTGEQPQAGENPTAGSTPTAGGQPPATDNTTTQPIEENDPFGPQRDFEDVDTNVKPFLRVANNEPHHQLFLNQYSTKVTYAIDDPNSLFVKAVAKLYVNDTVIATVEMTDKTKLEARFRELQTNVDYHIRTDVFYRNTQGQEESTSIDNVLNSPINDVVQVDFEERKLEIKNVDEATLWNVQDGHLVRKLRLSQKPTDLSNYYVTLKSDEHKDVNLPIAGVKEVVKDDGKTYFQFEANLMNAVSKNEGATKYTQNITFYIPKEEAAGYTNNFDTLISEMKRNTTGTFTLTQDLTASDTKLTPEAVSYIDQFQGTLIGNGYKIHDLKAPLFKNLKGTVKDITLSGVDIYQPSLKSVGSLAKESNQSARVENVIATGMILAEQYIGGLIGEASNTTLINVHFLGTLTSVGKMSSNNLMGGIAAWLGGDSRLEKGYVDASISAVSGDVKIGGLVGQMEHNNTTITDSYARGRIYYPTSRSSEVGGLVGTVLTGENIKIKNSISAMDAGIGSKVYGSSEHAAQRFENISVVADEAVGKDNPDIRTITKEEAKSRVDSLFPASTKPLSGAQKYNAYDINYPAQPYSRPERIQAYVNMEKLLPFFTRDVIIQHGNRLNSKDSLVTKKLVDVVPLTADGQPLFDLMGTEEQNSNQNVRKIDKITKLLLHFDDGSVEYHYVQKRNKEINKGAIVEYHLIDKNISYTPEVLLYDSGYKSLAGQLVMQLSQVSWESEEVTKALGLPTYNRSTARTEKESLLLKESFENVKRDSQRHISELLSNYNLVGIDSEAARNHLKKYVENNRAKLLLGLAYMDRWYGIQYGTVNAKEFMTKKADFFGKNINSLDQLIQLGGLGSEMLKPKNNAIVGGHIIGRSSIDGDLFDYLDGYRKAFAPNISTADWFNATTPARVIEVNSAIPEVLAKQNNPNDKTYSNRFFDKVADSTWRHPEVALLLLNLPKNEKTMYVLTNMTSTAIGMTGKYGTEAQVEKDLAVMAARMARHSDFWYNILPDKQKQDMFRNVIVWDSFSRSSNHNSQTMSAMKHFYNPLSLVLNCAANAGACADYVDIYFAGADLLGSGGSSTYTHELVHVADKTYLLDYGRRNGLGPESYALGLLQSLRSDNQDTIGINSIFDFKTEGVNNPNQQLTNTSPNRFKSAQDLQTYMKNYFDVVYTLDYLEAESVLKSQNEYAKSNWFNKMEVLPNANAANVTQVTRVQSHTAKTVEDLINAGFVSRRSYDPAGHGAVSYTKGHDEYLEINAFNPIYGSLNNDGVQRNEYEFRKLAFELLAEYGFANGFVPYTSNQYAKDLANPSYKAFADEAVIKKITTNQYRTSTEFRKAMFAKRKENMENLREVTITGKSSGGYYHGNTTTVRSLQELKELMDKAVQYDMNYNKYNEQSFGYNKTESAVYSLKAALLNGYLRATDEFATSIYKDSETNGNH